MVRAIRGGMLNLLIAMRLLDAFVVTDWLDHGSSSPFMKITRDVARVRPLTAKVVSFYQP